MSEKLKQIWHDSDNAICVLLLSILVMIPVGGICCVMFGYAVFGYLFRIWAVASGLLLINWFLTVICKRSFVWNVLVMASSWICATLFWVLFSYSLIYLSLDILGIIIGEFLSIRGLADFYDDEDDNTEDIDDSDVESEVDNKDDYYDNKILRDLLSKRLLTVNQLLGIRPKVKVKPVHHVSSQSWSMSETINEIKKDLRKKANSCSKN